MTIKEMDNFIQEYCNSLGNECTHCAIKHLCDPICGCFNKYKEICCEAYEIIENLQKTQPENTVLAVDKLTRHEQICDEIKALYKRKNADYGDSFHKTFVEEGMAMPRIRLTDKLERFKKLTKSGEQNVNDESVRDTLIDLANYAIMTILELEG